MPFLIEVVLPKWTLYQVSDMRSLAVHILEQMRTWFTLLCFESRWVDLSISFTTPDKISMVISVMGTVAHSAFRSLKLTDVC